MNTGFTVSAQITAVRPLSDRGASITFHTKELNEAEVALIVKQFQNDPIGWLLFKADEIQTEEIPKSDSDFEGKSQSQRMRAVLYILWQQRGSQGKFEDFYREKTELFINSIKAKLED